MSGVRTKAVVYLTDMVCCETIILCRQIKNSLTLWPVAEGLGSLSRELVTSVGVAQLVDWVVGMWSGRSTVGRRRRNFGQHQEIEQNLVVPRHCPVGAHESSERGFVCSRLSSHPQPSPPQKIQLLRSLSSTIGRSTPGYHCTLSASRIISLLIVAELRSQFLTIGYFSGARDSPSRDRQ